MKKFNWEDFAEGKIVVKFSSKEEIKDFCENAFIREFKFYNKRTKIKDMTKRNGGLNNGGNQVNRSEF